MQENKVQKEDMHAGLNPACNLLVDILLDHFIPAFGTEFSTFGFGSAFRTNCGNRGDFDLSPTVRAKLSPPGLAPAAWAALYGWLNQLAAAFRAEFCPCWGSGAILRVAGQRGRSLSGSIFGSFCGFVSGITQAESVGKAFYGCAGLSAAGFIDLLRTRAVFLAETTLGVEI